LAALFRRCLIVVGVLAWDMAKCPYCDYEGRVDSVEAHISGKCDEAHKGKVGQGFRDSLPQLPDETDQPEPEEPTATISPGWALIGATAVLAVVVIASTAPAEPVEDDDRPDDPAEGWA